MKYIYIKCLLVAFIIWLIPFMLTLNLHIDKPAAKQETKGTKDQTVERIMDAYSSDNRAEAFQLIFTNNLEVSVINIVGGVFLGLGTFINLLFNGFSAGSTFSAIHKHGMSWHDIIAHTAPHSIEMVGIWFSGGLGLYFGWLLLDFIRGKEPPRNLLKPLSIICTIIFFTILVAAYIEAYISVPKI